MHKRVTLYLFILISFLSQNIQAEKWTVYDRFNNLKAVAYNQGEIIGLSETGLVIYDKENEELRTISKINGLTHTSPSAINIYKGSSIIGFKNGGVNIIDKDKVYVMDEILYASSLKNKSINSIYSSETSIYLCCKFGIVWMSPERKEIIETWIVGQNSTQTSIIDMCIHNGMIYALDKQGVYVAPLDNSVNKMDYRNWSYFTIPFAVNLKTIEVFQDKIIVGGEGANTSIYQFDGTGIYTALPMRTNRLRTMYTTVDKMIVSQQNKLSIISTDLSKEKDITQLTWNEEVHTINPNDAIIDNNTLWVASAYNGLIKTEDHINGSNFMSEGPTNTFLHKVRAFQGGLYAVHGFLEKEWYNTFTPFKLTKFTNKEQWKYYTIEDIEDNKDLGFSDLNDVAIDPKDINHIFVSSWGSGLMEIKDFKCVEVLNSTNTPLFNIVPPGRYTRIGGMVFDKDGTLWMTNTNNIDFLRSYKDGEWKSFQSPDGDINSRVKTPFIVGRDIWIPKENSPEVFVMSKDGSQKKVFKIRALFQNNSESSFTDISRTNEMVVDKEQQVWVATDKGVFVYPYPENALTSNEFYAYQPSLDLNDDLFHPILKEESITSIAVDEANQKWIGTSASGVFLYSPDGTKQLKHFDTQNSPLPTNKIRQIVVEPVSGEVFIATNIGLVSLQGDAVLASDTMDNIEVYPSPFKPTEHIHLTIDKLAQDTEIRIIDSANNLIALLKSKGGRVTWDGKDRYGNTPATGVYQILASNPDGTITGKSKVLIIN